MVISDSLSLPSFSLTTPLGSSTATKGTHLKLGTPSNPGFLLFCVYYALSGRLGSLDVISFKPKALSARCYLCLTEKETEPQKGIKVYVAIKWQSWGLDLALSHSNLCFFYLNWQILLWQNEHVSGF